MIDRQGWETLVKPPVEGIVECTFPIRKAALSAPPVAPVSERKAMKTGKEAGTDQKILAELTGVGVKRNIFVLRRASLTRKLLSSSNGRKQSGYWIRRGLTNWYPSRRRERQTWCCGSENQL